MIRVSKNRARPGPKIQEEDPGMADKKITPKPAASKEKQAGDRAAARVSLRQTKRQTKRLTKRQTKKQI
jgi:hypothetical protein